MWRTKSGSRWRICREKFWNGGVTGDEKTGQSIYYQYWDHDGGSSAFRLWKEGRGSGCDNGGVGGDAGRDEDDRP